MRNRHWALIVFPPLALIPINFIFDRHGWTGSCSPFSSDLIFIPFVALLFGVPNSIRRSLFHRQDRRLYRSLLTVTICSGLFFHYSQLNNSVDQFVADLAGKVQARCLAEGKCPDTIKGQSRWARALNLRAPFYYNYRTNDDQSEFFVAYCLYESGGLISWSGGIQSPLTKEESPCSKDVFYF